MRKHAKTTSAGGSCKLRALMPSGNRLAFGNTTSGFSASGFLEVMISWRLRIEEVICEGRSIYGLFSTVSYRNLAA